MRRLGGMAGLSPAATASFGIGALAVAGLPPLNGFWSKFTLVRAGLAAGDVWPLVTVLLASALGLAYAARAFTLVFWGAVRDDHAEHWSRHRPRRVIWLAPLLLVALCIGAGLWPGPLLVLGRAIVTELDDPSIYIHAVLGGYP
jgi:formate hydrogenlyase subunit 3/multisubunit Na+/H+ antiporter MnhD subunit